MKKGYRKCVECGAILPKEDIVQIGGKAYCHKCSAPRAKEVRDTNALNAYLYDLCGGEGDIMPFLTSQVKRLKTQHEFKVSGILATLKFTFELSDNPPEFNPQYGIEYLVIRNYYQAKKYYEEIRKLSKQPQEMIDETLQTPVKEVHLSRAVMTEQSEAFIAKQKDLQYGPAIDLDSIEDEDDFEGEYIFHG